MTTRLFLFVLIHFAASLSWGWSQKPEDVTIGRVEILITESTSELESLFGHSALLLIPHGKGWRDGIVFDFVARTSDSSGFDYYRKGLTGKFPMVLQSMGLEEFLYYKAFKGGRDIDRVLLPLSQGQKNRLLWKLLRTQENPEVLKNYVFHYRNCASMILWALNESGISINYNEIARTAPITGVSPKGLPRLLTKAMLAPFPKIRIQSMISKVRSLEKKYSVPLRTEYNSETGVFKPWPSDFAEHLPKLSTTELLFVAQTLAPADRVRAEPIETLLRSRPRMNSIEFIVYRELPQSFYDLCRDEACFKGLRKDVMSHLSRRDVEAIRRKLSQTPGRAQIAFDFGIKREVDLKRSMHARHWMGFMDHLNSDGI